MEAQNPQSISIKKDIKRHWNEVSKAWIAKQDSRSEQVFKRALGEALGEDRKRVLDLGTGGGIVAMHFAEMGHDVTGFDVSDKMLVGAKQFFREKEREVSLMQGWASQLPFADSSYDVVENRGVFWTLPEPEQGIMEWIRVTKSGGKIIIFELEGVRDFKKIYWHLFLFSLKLKRWMGLLPKAGYSKKSGLKLKYDAMYKRMTIKDWPKYLSNFPVTQIEVKVLGGYWKMSRDPEKKHSILPFRDYFDLVSIMISFVVDKT